MTNATSTSCPTIERDRAVRLWGPRYCELLGVLAFESRGQLCYGERDEAFLDVVAGHLALGLQGLIRASDSAEGAPASPVPAMDVRRFTFYPQDDCIFVDGQYLIRNVPGRILWKLLTTYANERRTEFSNRELRLDASLGSPHCATTSRAG